MDSPIAHRRPGIATTWLSSCDVSYNACIGLSAPYSVPTEIDPFKVAIHRVSDMQTPVLHVVGSHKHVCLKIVAVAPLCCRTSCGRAYAGGSGAREDNRKKSHAGIVR